MEYTGQGHGASQPLSVMMHELLAQAYGRSTSARAFLQGRSCPGSRAYNMLSCTIAPDESRSDSEALSSTPTSCVPSAVNPIMQPTPLDTSHVALVKHLRARGVEERRQASGHPDDRMQTAASKGTKVLPGRTDRPLFWWH